MTNETTASRKRQFTLTWLPWLLGALVLLVYLITVNRSFPAVPDWTSLLQQPPSAARLAGYTFAPEFLAPVYYVVTGPLRLLPDAYIPFALNLFSAVCGALALAQLARSVALLPHDRTRIQRERVGNRTALLNIPLAWLPPVLATTICALSLSVWEHGTNGTTEMFDLLLFAYVVRSFLEYRRDENESRLFRTAFVFGAAMTNNLAMIAFFPLFIAALVWTRKLAFFNVRFLTRMALCGLAGLAFYLVLPTISSLQGGHSLSFWQLLTNNVMAQKWLLFLLPRNTILLFSLTSIIPVFLLSIRWSSQFGDPSRVGVVITTAAFHLCHIVVLIACCWMMLNPDFSPRHVGYGLAFLPIYFLAALSIGYYSGYLLLVSQPPADRFRGPSGLARTAQIGAATGVAFLGLATIAVLLHRNVPQIRLTNGPLQSQMASHLAETLPDKGVILSDEPYRIWLIEDWLARHNRSKDYIVLCSLWMPSPDYQNYLARRYPQWTPPETASDAERIPDTALALLVEKLGREQPVAYLHPSFGYYFEVLASQPNGLGVLLTPYDTNNLSVPPPSPEVIASNQKFWSSTTNDLAQTLRPHVPPLEPQHERLGFPENLYQRIGLKPPKNKLVTMLGGFYSRSLVNWAVELQRASRYDEAVAPLQLAQDLNPQNIVADINLVFNQKYRRGESMDLELDRPMEEYFGTSRSWDQLLAINGPYDTPGLSFAQGYLFLRGNLVRQAAAAFERARQLATNDITSRLWLGQLNLNRNFPDRTLEMITEIRQIARRVPGLSTNLNDLFTLEAAAYLTKNKDAVAHEIITTNLARFPNDFNVLASACKAYADNRRYTNALELTDRMLKIQPDNVACWINRGCFLVEFPNYPEAIESFTRAINLETNNYRAILYRGIAYLRSEQLDKAREDYETVQRQFPKEPTIDFGLAEIAYQRKDTNTAILHYQSYLDNAPAGTAEAKLVTERLAELKGTPPQPPASPPAKSP